MAEGLDELMALADRARSPVLKLWTAEMAIEHAYATGRWDGGIAMGEHSIDIARNLNQESLLTRLLVWTSMFYVGRGDFDRAKALVDEACALAETDDTEEGNDIYRVVPALTGLAHYLVAVGEYEEGVATARRGLEVVHFVFDLENLFVRI